MNATTTRPATSISSERSYATHQPHHSTATATLPERGPIAAALRHAPIVPFRRDEPHRVTSDAGHPRDTELLGRFLFGIGFDCVTAE